ncbi:DUF4358 domain-containing protein [Ruminococcus difficilis]|uniref:DUF4358 domain-containing protein n=1 Tax=Ruminococcus difficilis TaxID=2763069 RepID=A0A934U290_9FIRM|nr:DUF4358 domain-containing protein [Ruminococcus difficilis]MBK6088094.1 DUF4358 domain-containing protein [Ruminococcus difficilis]
MKRVFTIIIAAVLALAMLTACGAKNVDLKKVLDDINSKYDLSTLTAVDNVENLKRYYTIPPEDVKQFAAEFTKAASEGYTEVILIEAVDADAAGRIKTQLDSRLRSQLSDAKSYNAEQVSMIEACSPKDNGNFVWLVISDKQADINADIEKALK